MGNPYVSKLEEGRRVAECIRAALRRLTTPTHVCLLAVSGETAPLREV